MAGSLKSTLGAGAVVDRLTITGQPQPAVFAFKGREVDFFARGTQRNKFTGTDTIQQDGSQTVVVNGRYTGGTGIYRGTSGHYRFNGTVPPNSTVLSGRSRGSIRF